MDTENDRIKRWSLLKIIESFTGEYITGFFLLVSTFGIFFEIIARKVLLTSIFGLEEIVSFSMMILTFLTLSINQREEQHIRMELVVEKLTPTNRRLMQRISLVLSVLTFALITYAGVLYCIDLYDKEAITVLLAWPFWPIYIVVPLGSILLCLQLGVEFKNSFKEPVGGPDHLIV